jgi:hypothetical protein
MSGITTIALAKAAAQTWRNGGGVTRELLAWPLQAAPGAWRLRVSVADIDRDGPFSAFPGVQRGFAVLEGEGVVLALAAGERRLTREQPPLVFDGAEAPGCRLVGGPTRDLNLMVRRKAGDAVMRTASTGPLRAGPPWRGLYAASAGTLRADGRPPLTLPPHTLAWSDADEADWHWSPNAATAAPRAWWLALAPRT